MSARAASFHRERERFYGQVHREVKAEQDRQRADERASHLFGLVFALDAERRSGLLGAWTVIVAGDEDVYRRALAAVERAAADKAST